MKRFVVFAVFCAVTALSQVTAKAMAEAERDNIDLKEELKDLVESIELRNFAQEKQDQSSDTSETQDVEEAKAMAEAERDNIDLKEELKDLVESIELRNFAQEKQDQSSDTSETQDVEEEKRGRCPDGEYPCVGGRCIPVRWICDGDRDCPDGEDERICRDYDCDRYCDYGGCKNRQIGSKCYPYCYCYGSGYAQFCDNCQA